MVFAFYIVVVFGLEDEPIIVLVSIDVSVLVLVVCRVQVVSLRTDLISIVIIAHLNEVLLGADIFTAYITILLLLTRYYFPRFGSLSLPRVGRAV